MGDTPVAVAVDSSVYYVHTDHLNTPRKITNTSNGVRWQWDPTPFGNGLPNQNPQGLGVFNYYLRFPGQYYDNESQLHYNYFRNYDSYPGRYVQSDPIGLDGGVNTYAYALGNPVRNVDPFGLEVGAAMASINRATMAGLNVPSSNSTCEKCECWLTCLSEDPLLPELLGGLVGPFLNLKTPGEMRPGTSPFTSLDRRLPPGIGANPRVGATVTRGTIQRVKCVGRYGTAAAAVGAFTVGYSIGAAGRCWIECQ